MSESPVGIFLKNTNFLQGFASVFRVVFLGLSVLAIGLLCAISFDAALALPSWLRVLVDVVLLSLVFVLGWKTTSTLMSYRFNARKTARRVETGLEIENNSLVNTIDLSEQPDNFTSQSLREKAVKQGYDVSREYSPFSAVSFGPLLKVLFGLLLVFLVSVAFYLAVPKLFHRVIPRYLDPFGNHPAFTSLQFEIEVNPETIYQGQAATVNVIVDGPSIPSTANIIQLGTDEIKTPMMRLENGEFFVRLENLDKTIQCCVETERGQSDPFEIKVQLVPTFEKVWVRYDFPEYTGWQSQRRLLDSRGIVALQGTDVALEVESNIPLASGNLSLDTTVEQEVETQTLPLTSMQSAPNFVSGSFELGNQDRFAIDLVAANGAASLRDFSGQVIGSPDLPPQIKFVQPDPHVIAVEGWKIPVRIQAADDVGLRSVQMFRSINGIGPYALPLYEDNDTKPGASETLQSMVYEFDLGELGAKSGDVITYYASVTDNYPINYPSSEDHIGTTDTFVIQVISLEEYEELARQNYRMDDVIAEMNEIREKLEALNEQRNEILEAIDELQEKLDAGEQLTDEEKQRLEDLKDQLDQFAKQTEALADELQQRAEQTPIYDFEESYQEMLSELAEQLQQQAENANEASQAMDSPQSQPLDKEALQKALEQFKNNDQPFDQSNQQQMDDMQSDLNQLAGAEKMLEQVGRMKSIIEQQRQIADRMAEFRDSAKLSDEQKQRLKQLAKQQDLLKEELKDAMEKMEEAANESEADFPQGAQSLRDIVQAIKESGALEDQGQAAKSGRQGQGKPAHQSAEEAAKKLEALQCDCNGNSLGQEMAGDSPLSIPKSQMSKSLQQLAQSMQLPGMKPGSKQGNSGSGRQGSATKATLFGPHKPSNRRSEARRGNKRNMDQGRGFGPDSAAQFGSPENLTPEARETQSGSLSNLQGVPNQYRDHAKAYLKRLSEDENTSNQNQD